MHQVGRMGRVLKQIGDAVILVGEDALGGGPVRPVGQRREPAGEPVVGRREEQDSE